MTMQTTDARPQTIVYTLTVTVTRAIPDEGSNAAQMDASADWMVSGEAKRELEKELLRALRKLDGDCDCEVMSAARTERL